MLRGGLIHILVDLESLVRSAKVALKVMLRGASLNDESFISVMTEVEALLNARPLTHVPVDPVEPEALTPNHFLLGRVSANLSPLSVAEEGSCLKRRWKFVEALTNQFWRRWLKEYIPDLACRNKWVEPARDLEVDDGTHRRLLPHSNVIG